MIVNPHKKYGEGGATSDNTTPMNGNDIPMPQPGVPSRPVNTTGNEDSPSMPVPPSMNTEHESTHQVSGNDDVSMPMPASPPMPINGGNGDNTSGNDSNGGNTNGHSMPLPSKPMPVQPEVQPRHNGDNASGDSTSQGIPMPPTPAHHGRHAVQGNGEPPTPQGSSNEHGASGKHSTEGAASVHDSANNPNSTNGKATGPERYPIKPVSKYPNGNPPASNKGNPLSNVGMPAHGRKSNGKKRAVPHAVNKDKGKKPGKVKKALQNGKEAIKNAGTTVVNGAKETGKAAIKNAVVPPEVQMAMEKAQAAGNAVKRGANVAKNAVKNTVNTAKDIAVKTGRTIQGIVKTILVAFTPPQLFITLTAIIVVLSLLVTIGAVQSFGPSAIDCATSGGDTTTSSSSTSGNSDNKTTADGVWNNNAETIAREFQREGFSKIAAASAMGNLKQESGFDPNATNPSSGAYGIAQWLGGRKSALQEFASGKGKPESDVTVQTEFLLHEAMDSGQWMAVTWRDWIAANYPGQGLSGADLKMGWAAAKGGKDGIKKATSLWLAAYERAGRDEGVLDNRIAYANAVYDHLDSIGGNWASEGSVPDSFKNGDSTSSNSAATASGQSASELVCGDNNSSNTAVSGAIGGAKECDGAGYCTFDWMCDSMHICKDGDYGIIPAPYQYQCVWYAWTRAAMVYKSTYGSKWNTVLGNGGDIWVNAKGTPGWEVSDKPKAGDIVSGRGVPFSDGGAAGHVAFVEKVEQGPNGWRIYISEGNANGSASFHSYKTRWIDEGSGASLHFVRNKAWDTK